MARRYVARPTPDDSVTEAALEALDAEGLRALVRGIISWLDESTHARLVNALVDRAARSTTWVPDDPTDDAVSDIVRFAEAARRVACADASDVDDYLRQGSLAFLGKGYHAAVRIFRALLIPLGNGDIDLGQHEMLDEVLGVDLAACTVQYVVSTYMTTTPNDRAKAVLAAIDDVRGVGELWQPLRELERVAVEPLPELEAFFADWRVLVEERAKNERRDWDSNADRWLREVVRRTEGPEGLAKVARRTKRSGDLDAWCSALVEAKDWARALEAYVEAAELVADKACSRGAFLDGAALAAQQLGRKDLPLMLERAWRQAPSMVRLRRWLGSATNKKTLRARGSLAFEACPPQAARQLRGAQHVCHTW